MGIIEILQGKGFSLIKTQPEIVLAPCQPDGKVNSVNDDTKDAICRCRLNPRGCFVDARNHVIQDSWHIVFEN